MAPHLTITPNSVRKVCQLTGERDRERRTWAFNRTESRFRLSGTDLGYSFEHDGRLWFLFGDTVPNRTARTGGIAAVSRAPQHMEVVAVAEDGAIQGKWFWDGWQDWFELGGARFPPTAWIAAVSRAPQHMEIFAVAADGVIRGKWFWDGWRDWFELGGARFSHTTGIAAVSRAPEHMEVFAVGEDGVLRARWFWNGWKDWFALVGPRFSQTAGISAVSRAPEHMEVFAVGEDGVVRAKWFWNGWKDWFALDGARFSQTAGLAAVSRAPEHMEVFAVGEDGVIRARWFWNGWKDWFELGDARFSRTAGIAALSREPRHMEIFAVGVDGAIRKNVFWDGWKGWEVLSCEDSVAWTDSTHPEPGVRLHFVNNAGVYRSPRVIGANGAQLRTGCLEVPIAGFSAGGQMFVFYSTDAFVENDHGLMGRTVLCRAEGGDPTNLHVLYDVSDIRRHPRGHFINVACVVVPEGLDGLPFRGPALLAWGSGRYRQSDVYLAAVPLERLGSRSAWRFFTGLGPIPWSHHEQQATKLFSHPEVGELSVGWIQPFNAWLMLYNAGNPRGIVGRVAPAPWGPWSDPPVRVFDPDAPGVGYGEFMHRAGSGDGLSDPGREREWGGEYGPYLIDRYTKALPADEAGPRVQAYFVMSTWNPYNTVLMTATLGVSE